MPSIPISMASSARFLLLLLALLAAVATSSTHGYSAPEEKLTRFRFYFHEIFAGPNATAKTVAVPPGTDFAFTTFGEIGVIDDMLREGPDPASPLLGRAQGIVTQASQQGFQLFTAFNLVFTAGEFNGSTLAIIGRSAPSDPPPIERSIVGGSGKFRMARGYTLTRVITPAPADNYLLMKIDAYVFHR